VSLATRKRRKRIRIIGPQKLTKYERARIVGARALQLALGAPPLIEVSSTKDPIEVAEEELKAGVLPIVIRRRLPNGRYQDIPIKYLLRAEGV